MTTALEVITDALRDIGVVGEDETPQGEISSGALRRLNQMLHGWAVDGIDLGHSDLTLAQTLPYPPDHDLAIIHNLAVNLASKYGVPPSAATVALARELKTALGCYYTTPKKMSTPNALNPRWNANRYGGGSYDIDTDT